LDKKVNEILVSTYSGRILGLIDEDRKAANIVNKPNLEKKINEAKILEIKLEIEKLENTVELLRAEMGEEKIMTIPTSNKATYKMTKIEKTNHFKILLDSQNPIQTLAIECSKSILISQSLDSKFGIFSETPEEFSTE